LTEIEIGEYGIAHTCTRRRSGYCKVKILLTGLMTERQSRDRRNADTTAANFAAALAAQARWRDSGNGPKTSEASPSPFSQGRTIVSENVAGTSPDDARRFCSLVTTYPDPMMTRIALAG
jgi:hypothetical protein